MHVGAITPKTKAAFSIPEVEIPLSAEQLVADSAFSNRPFFSIFGSSAQSSMKQEAYKLLMEETTKQDKWVLGMIGEMYQLTAMGHKPLMNAFEEFSGETCLDVWLGRVKINPEVPVARVDHF